MNARRFATVAAASCGTVVLAGWVVASLAGFGSAGIEITAAAPIDDRRAPSLAADTELAVAPQATAMGNAAVAVANTAVANPAIANTAIANAAVASAEVATATEPVMGTATDTTAASETAASDKPESIVVAALPDSSQMLPPETPAVAGDDSEHA